MSVSPYMAVLEKLQQELKALVEILKEIQEEESPSFKEGDRDSLITWRKGQVNKLSLDGYTRGLFEYLSWGKTSLNGLLRKSKEEFGAEVEILLLEILDLQLFIEETILNGVQGYLYPYDGCMVQNHHSRNLLKEVARCLSGEKNRLSHEEFLKKINK